ncbi:MAG TPA: hypothetical protein VHJ38_08100 [Nitrososphaeraceae archaeon]|nr:hypothetical protein [Nitrososphaeraceae archaeon]
MTGKLFDSETIQPKGFIKYVATYESLGTYIVYTTTDPILSK